MSERYSVSYTVIGNGSATAQVAESKTSIYTNLFITSLSATPNDGWVFKKWGQLVAVNTGTGSTTRWVPPAENPWTGSIHVGQIENDKSEEFVTITVVVEFEESSPSQYHTVTTSANPITGGATSGHGTYLHGDVCTIIATPAEGYRFSHWSGISIIKQKQYSFTVLEDSEWTAYFIPKTNLILRSSSNPNLIIRGMSNSILRDW